MLRTQENKARPNKEMEKEKWRVKKKIKETHPQVPVYRGIQRDSKRMAICKLRRKT